MNIAMINNKTGKKEYKTYKSVSQIISDLSDIDLLTVHEYSKQLDSDIKEYENLNRFFTRFAD